MQINKKRAAAVIGATAVGLAGAGVAFAYWTSTGQGSGSATTGSSTAFTVTADTVTAGGLTPGGPSDTIHYTVHNGGSGVERLSQITVQVANLTGTSPTASPSPFSSTDTASDPACTKSDFSISGAGAGNTYTIDSTVDSNLPKQLAAGGEYSGSVTLQMVNAATNQNSCQGVTVPLYFSAS
jgi:hypothetical protein